MVFFVNSFTVPEGREDDFVDQWTEVNAYMAGKPGYVDHTLHRSVDGAAPYRFVNVAHWESADLWRAAHDDGFRALMRQPHWQGFASTPVLYDAQPVHAGQAGEK